MSASNLSELPVTLVSGYLGSGKTTYINQRLQQADGVRYGVLVNDFGDLNIDESLIESEDINTVSLTNGCVCCSLAHDVDGAISMLEAQSDNLDWVLFEASGVADPRRLSSKVENWPGLRLAESMTLVDVTRIKKLVDDKFVGGHIRAQLTSRNDFYLTKTDLVSASETKSVVRWLANLQSDHSREAEVSLPEFFSQVIQLTESISDQDLRRWLAQMPASVIRIKGYVEMANEVYLLQWVEGIYALTQQVSLSNNKLKNGVNLVVIGSKPLTLAGPA